MTEKNLAKELVKLQKKWVALSPDRRKIVASSFSLEKLEQLLGSYKNKEAILLYVPELSKLHAPST